MSRKETGRRSARKGEGETLVELDIRPPNYESWSALKIKTKRRNAGGNMLCGVQTHAKSCNSTGGDRLPAAKGRSKLLHWDRLSFNPSYEYFHLPLA